MKEIKQIRQQKENSIMKNYLCKIDNVEEVVNEEYNNNKRSLMDGKETVLNCIEEEKKDGFDKSYFSAKITFSKGTKEYKEEAISSACIRMLAFKKFIEEELGYKNIETDVVVLDNYTVYVRAIVHY